MTKWAGWLVLFNISGKQALDLLRVFFEYASPMAAVRGCAVFALLGLLLALAVLVVCAKFGVFRRRNRFWHFAAKLYWVYVPVVFMAAGVGFGLLRYVERESVMVAGTALLPVKHRALEILSQYPPELAAKLSLPGLKQMMRDNIAKVEFQVKGLDKVYRVGDTVKLLPTSVRGVVLDAVVDRITDELNLKLSKATGLERDSLARLWRQDAIELLNGDFLDRALSLHVRQVIRGYQQMLGLLLLGFLMVPVADTVIAGMLEGRDRALK